MGADVGLVGTGTEVWGLPDVEEGAGGFGLGKDEIVGVDSRKVGDCEGLPDGL